MRIQFTKGISYSDEYVAETNRKPRFQNSSRHQFHSPEERTLMAPAAGRQGPPRPEPEPVVIPEDSVLDRWRKSQQTSIGYLEVGFFDARLEIWA